MRSGFSLAQIRKHDSAIDREASTLGPAPKRSANPISQQCGSGLLIAASSGQVVQRYSSLQTSFDASANWPLRVSIGQLHVVRGALAT